MRKRFWYLPLAVLLLAGLLLVVYLNHHSLAVLSPEGPISSKERGLMSLAILLSIIVVVPVYIMTIAIVWKYRERNHSKSKYTPDWDRSWLFETIWWGIPLIIISILSVATWQSSHTLDPYRSLTASKQPLTIQVISLDWKWLFIYPQQQIASVNYVAIPTDTPINFEITSDTVMNSFWIPQLGGQIYAMPGMSTELHLMAGKPGSYRGSSANISGKGFAGMNFMTVASNTADFGHWVDSVRESNTTLDQSTYQQLARPSNVSVSTYAQADRKLYDAVMMKYMMPPSATGVQQ